MNSPSDEEEEANSSHGRPNAWWAAQREAAKEEPDTFTGSFRAVPVPHAGQRTVKAEDTKGAEDLCWCGQPLNHDWPGKAAGTKHPKGTSVTTMTEAPPHIDKRQLRGYHQDLQEVIVTAVNKYGCRYKLGANTCTIYAKDGDHTCRIAARNSTREVKRVREWFAKYVIGLDVTTGKIENPLVRDGKVLIDDLEAREKRDRREAVRVAEEKRQAAIEESLRLEAEEKLRVEQAEILRLARELNSEEHPVPEPPKTRPEKRVSTEETWVPYVSPDPRRVGQSERYETNGEIYRCKECVGTDHEFVKSTNGLGGHTRMYHTDTTSMYDEAAQIRKSDSLKAHNLRTKVDEAIDLLIKATGYEGDSAAIAKLEAEVDRLKRQNADLRKECGKVEEANKRADDAEARLALIQEAIRA